jgi:hypothetical protein
MISSPALALYLLPLQIVASVWDDLPKLLMLQEPAATDQVFE